MAEATNLTLKTSETALDAIIVNITQVLAKDDKLTLMGFGTFEVTKRAARVGRNPKNSEVINISAKSTPRFKAGKILKEAVATLNVAAIPTSQD